MSVTIFSKKSCPACEKAKAFLSKLGVEYEVRNIDVDMDAMDFIAMAGHRSVPQIYKDGNLAIEGGWTGMEKMSEDEVMKVLG